MDTLGGVALGLGVTGAGVSIADPYIRNTIISSIRMKASQSARDNLTYSKNFEAPQAAIERADNIYKNLIARGFDPKEHRLAISATGGTGKSTTAKLLAQKMNMKYTSERTKMPSGFSSIAPKGTDLTGRKYTEAIAKAKSLPKGAIYEQTYLIPTVTPDRFDAMVYLNRDPKEIYAGLLKRKRGAAMRHFVDYPLLDSVIRSGYEETKGRSFSPEKGVHIKMKPKSGYQADKKLDRALELKGVSKKILKDASRQEKLYTLHGKGGRTKSFIGRNFAPEYDKSKLVSMLGILGGGALAGALLAARYKSKNS